MATCRQLSANNIRVNVTLILRSTGDPARAGAYYVSPFVGRLDDQSVLSSGGSTFYF